MKALRASTVSAGAVSPQMTDSKCVEDSLVVEPELKQPRSVLD